jgi:xanthine/uracil permease
VAWSGGHPRSLGWTVLVAAVGSILAGLVQAYAGEPVTFTRVATIIFPTVITLWVAWMGLRLLRTEAGAARSMP